MIAVKRLEIVVDAPSAPRVTEILERAGLSGWTQLVGASGQGDRGPRQADELTGVGSNCVIVAACPPDQLGAITESLRTVLSRVGGICLVSDAMWLKH